jgi:hypothetical protein
MSVEMKNKTLDILLSVEQSGDDIIANLLFHNNGEDNIYLDTWVISMGNVFVNNIFSIRDENNNRIQYVGMMACRDIEPEDFVVLNPQEEIKTMITINKGYRLTKGKKYTIQYCANNVSYLDKQKLMELWSNKVEVEYV